MIPRLCATRAFMLCAVAALVVAPAVASGEPVIRRVLMLQSLDRGNLAHDTFTGNFRVDVDQGSPDPVTFTQIVVGPTRLDGSLEKATVGYLRALVGELPRPDLIVTVGGPAAAFARKYRHELFPESPLLLASLDERFLEGTPLAPEETALAVRSEFSQIVEDILQLFPQTSHVFMVVGSGATSRFWRAALEPQLRRFAPRVSFTWSHDMSYTAVLQAVSRLPARSAIFYLTFDADVHGGAFPEERVLSDLRAAANAPLFAPLDSQLGHGIVGGRLVRTSDFGAVAAGLALRILGGESPGHVRVPVQKPGPPVFDWRELNRWGVGEGRLPAGSIVRFREESAWQRYRWLIVAGVSALLAQAFLIGALLLNRRRRRRAEQSLRENVADLQAARGALSNLSRRLMAAQEQERARLARELHDDIGQRMSFLAMDAAQLRDTLSDRPDAQRQARSFQEAVLAVGREVQGISHRLHASKIDLLGLPAVAGSFCQELASRHSHLKVAFAHDGVPRRLPDNVALTLFRVLQEALSNAVKHANARQCTVTLQGVDDELRLEVRDDGRGFDVRHAVGGHGLGLISMRERLTLVNGDVVVESRPGGGTVVRANVPLGSTAEADAHEGPSSARPKAASATT